MPVTSCSSDQPAWKWVFPGPPSSGLWGWLTELKKALYLLLLVYYKGYNSREAKGKEAWGKILRRGVGNAQSFCVFSVHHPPCTLMYSSTWRLSEPWLLGFLWRFHDVDRIVYSISHWCMNSFSSPSPYPRGGAERSNSNQFPWQPHPSWNYLGSYQKSPY